LVDSLAVEAAFTMAFTCFLRMDEITYDRFDPNFQPIAFLDRHRR